MLGDEDFVKTTLITGESELCKNFHFEAAITWAKEGHHVYYFSHKQLESIPASFHDRSEPSVDALKLVTFICTATYDDLANQLVRLPTFRRQASIILIEDLDYFTNKSQFFGCTQKLHVARLCAIILNSAYCCSRIANRSVQICVSGVTHLDVYRRYFDNVWSINENNDNIVIQREDGTKVFELSRLDDDVIILKRILDMDEEEES